MGSIGSIKQKAKLLNKKGCKLVHILQWGNPFVITSPKFQ